LSADKASVTKSCISSYHQKSLANKKQASMQQLFTKIVKKVLPAKHLSLPSQQGAHWYPLTLQEPKHFSPLWLMAPNAYSRGGYNSTS
jgi:hypothetical protein